MPARGKSILAAVGAVMLAAALIDLCGRELARASFLAVVGLGVSDLGALTIALLGTGTVCILAARLGAAARRRATVAACLGLLFAAGVVAQLRLGARLQSDGFYYYAYLRSLWFDGDVEFSNDYKMLGLGDKPYLFEPTPTGHAQSAWTIGPAIVWSPFFGVGHVVARSLNARGHPSTRAQGAQQVSVDGTSFPYRQAICLAGLFYGLLGLWWCGRLASSYVRFPIALLAAIGIGGGSFILWYIVKEPTMTHAPSMAAVAGFCLLWERTRANRTRGQWLALGLVAGLMTDIRWQNAIFCLLPAIDVLRARDRQTLINGLMFTGAGLVAFLPQMLAWKAIYGAFFAISPLGPQIRWTAPHLVDILWSSRNGLFATSPVTYAAALGLLAFAWRNPRVGLPALATIAFMVYFNAAIQDWWGSAAFGMRRFDGILPLLTIGLATAIEWTERAIGRHPRAVLCAGLAGMVVWNLTFIAAAVAGDIRIGEAISFRRIAGAQAATLSSWMGHPFSYPVNLLYALRYGVAPERYDLLGPNRFLGDPLRPYGRIDIGDGTELEAAIVGGGWHAPERDGAATFRWASQETVIDVPLDHAADLKVQIRLKAFSYPGSPGQTVTLDMDGTPLGPFEVTPDWRVLETQTPRAVWRAGPNRVTLRFGWQATPAQVGLGGDARPLSAAVDYFRVEKPR